MNQFSIKKYLKGLKKKGEKKIKIFVKVKDKNIKKWQKLSKKQKIQYTGAGFLILIAALGLSFYFIHNRTAEADWFDDGWHYRRKLTFNNLASSENLTNFPVLVSLNSSRVNYNNTQDSGQDIRFTDPNGAILKYEIEKWDETATSTVWVKIPQIDASSTIDYIYMYYGNPDASDSQSATNVWDSNFKMVQHLEESCSSSSCVTDSTLNLNSGTPYSSSTITNLYTSSGYIDGANSLDGIDDYISLPNIALGTTWTAGAWIKRSSGSGIKTIIDFNDNTNVCYLRVGELAVDKADLVCSGNLTVATSTISVSDSTWHYVVGVRDGSTAYMYVDGVQSGTPDTSFTTNTFTSTQSRVGRELWSSSYYFPWDGQIDEVRFSSSARSAEWIEAEYKTMTDTYITYGGEENQEGAVVVWHFNEGSGSTAYDDSNYDNNLAISGASWITGKFGNALSFDGTNDVATTTDSSTLSPTGSFSISAWIKRDASSNIDVIANKWNDSSGSYRFFIDSSDKLALALEGPSGSSTSTSATTITDTNWHHVAAVYNTVTPSVSFYIDGKAETSISTTGWSGGNTANLLVQLRGASAVYKDSNEVYIFGGYDNSDSQFNTNIYKFDPSSPTTNSTDTGHDLPQGLEYAPAVYYPSTDKVYVFGGYWLSGTDAIYTDEIVEYNVATGAVTNSSSIVDLPIQLAGASAALNTSNNLIYIFGGWDNTNSQFNTNIYTFNPASPNTAVVDTGNDLPSGRRDAPVVYDSATSKFYIFGGYQGTITPTYLTQVVQYNYSNGVATTTNIGALPKQLRGASAVYKSFNEIYIFGGWNNTDEIYNANIYKFDPSSPSTAAADTGYDLPVGLKDAPAIYDTSGGKSYVFGGYYGTTESTYLNSIVKLNSQAIAPSITDGSQSFVVGAGETAAGSYNNFFGGDIDELYFYNFALTSAQVLRNYNTELAAAVPIQFGSGTTGTTTSPVAYWRLDSGVGAVGYDDTSNNNDLAISGASWTTSGKFGNALSFDGVNDVATSSNSTSLNIQGNLSISAWVKATNFATTTQQWIVHKDSGSAGYAFGFGKSANKMALKIDGTDYESDTTFSLTNNTWHHFGVSLSGTSTTFYIDGKQLGGVVNGANAPPADSTAQILRIGSNGTTYLSGVLDEIRIYNYARTEAENRVDYNTGKAVTLGKGSSEQLSGWYNSNWKYRKPITLSRPSGAVTNYQMQVIVNRSTGTDSGTNVYVGTKCLSNYNDIRFTKSDGTTLLDYWIESSASASSTIWIEFDSIGTSATTFYMYYGNSGASTVSSGANTFILFDDFERGSNGDAIGGSWSVLGGSALISTDHAYGTGTRSGKFGVSYTRADIPLIASESQAIMVRFWKEDAVNTSPNIMHGNGTYTTDPYVDSSENLLYWDGASKDTTKDVTADVWQLIELNKFNFTARTYDIYLNGSLATSSAGMWNSATGGNVIRMENWNTTAGWDVYLDNLLVRQYLATEPSWGSWGGEEQGTEPIAVWRLDEGQGGTAYDDKNGNNDGTVSASSTMGNWTAGKYGNAIDFDGANDYITAPDSVSLSITGDLSVSAWIRLDAVSKEQTILGKWDETTANNDRSYRLWLDSSNNLNFSVSTDGTTVVTQTDTNITFSAGTWYHIEGTYDDAGTMKLYINGILQNTKSSGVPASIDDNTSLLYIGAKENTAGNADTKFDGVIDDVRIYNYTGSASQVLIDYNGGFAVRLGD